MGSKRDSAIWHKFRSIPGNTGVYGDLSCPNSGGNPLISAVYDAERPSI
jgi:hypothetical protein